MLDIGNPSRPSRDANRRNEKAAANQENIPNCPVWPDKNPSNDPRECKRGHRGSCSPVTAYRHQFRSAVRMVSLAVRFVGRLIKAASFSRHIYRFSVSYALLDSNVRCGHASVAIFVCVAVVKAWVPSFALSFLAARTAGSGICTSRRNGSD
jgi:hypothetical protein